MEDHNELKNNKIMKVRYTTYSLNLLLFIISIFFLTACNPRESNRENLDYYQDQGEVFATGYSIKYEYDRSLKNEIEAELEKFDQSLNPFKENSIITNVNNNIPVELDSFFLNVFNKSMEVSVKTQGYFDVTISPLINAWGFGFQNMENISQETIDSLKEFVGYEKIKIEKGEIVKSDPRVELNTSAIAKGYSCDVIADLLESFGVENYMIYIGGEISARGVNEQGVCWRIGIDKPRDDLIFIQHDIQVILSLCNKSLATSGNYRNYYVKDGKKYAHTIDPYTGYPSETDVLSATVIANDCMTADAYATAFVAMGIDKSIEIANSIPDLYYYFIYENESDGSFAIKYSDGFEQFLVENIN